MQPISPIHTVQFNDREILIKRDDLLDPFISGNKWRKLKYILKDVQAKGKSHIVTFGGAYSNHILATAAAAARNGLQASAFVRGEEVDNEILFLCRLFGMELIFTSRTDYRNKELLFDRHFGTNPNAYFIDEGGAGLLGAAGCAEIARELPEDLDHIFCAAGTGTTAAGLLNGLAEINHQATLHIIPVLNNSEYLAMQIKNLSNNNNYLLYNDYIFGGYAKTTPALIAFLNKFIAATGILIDPVYTAKMFFAIDNLQHKTIKADERVLAIHTGGLLGTFGMKSKLK